MNDYVVEVETRDGSTKISNLDGIPWHKARIPWRFHKCWAQTKGWINYFESIERCACGAIRLDRGRFWLKRNQRRKGKK